MSQSRQEEEESDSEEKHEQKPEANEKEADANVEESGSGPSVGPQTSIAEQTQKQENWLWSWFPFPLLSGLTWLGDRYRPLQEPVCCQLETRRSFSKMCPECEIMFCKKCETLHYSQAFIEHGLLGHSTESLPKTLSPALRADVQFSVERESNHTCPSLCARCENCLVCVRLSEKFPVQGSRLPQSEEFVNKESTRVNTGML
ncbi:uncharacterized protein C17orf50 homolog [Rhineura floridana]|uniref:uncharacterized protein C17orf50 homolog n=1 Tax=Rhineura floridana TaxID=261503 RepID=UPI002AC89366|nr:uncharacterized protein C17orf50 homolog [Rhineura floridana]